MKILLTGGAGFIGSSVSDEYLKNGHEVLIVDNLSTGDAENIPAGAEFSECDIRDREKLSRLFSEFNPEIVNHHAAQINVRRSVDDPVEDANINVTGSINILEESVKCGVRRIIFSSTGGAIYGEPDYLPVDEKTAQSPLSPYGVSKLCAENYFKYYRKLFGLDSVILRYSNVYGERQNPHGEAGVVAIFCTSILNSKPCRIFGDGNQTRDYVHVSDVCSANVLSLNCVPGIYNIGTSVETSVNDIVNELRNITGQKFEVVHDDERTGEVRKISLDNRLALERIGWKPETGLREGLGKTWDWFSNHRK